MRHRVDRVEARDVKLQLVKLGATPSQLKRPEVAELSKILYENEIIEAFILGYYDGGYGMMVATNIRVVFIDITPFGRLKIDDIPYGSVNSVELQIGMFFASVSLFTVHALCNVHEQLFLYCTHYSSFHLSRNRVLIAFSCILL